MCVVTVCFVVVVCLFCFVFCVCGFCLFVCLFDIFFFLQDYPGDEILIVYDYEFKHGQNFYIALTEEAKELILNVSIAIVHTHTMCQYHQSDFSFCWPELGWPVACSLWNVSTFLMLHLRLD